jgi:hypothetical protein
MDKICGEIKMVGDLTGGELRTQVDEYGRQRFVGSYRSASVLDALQIGDTTLLKSRCQADVYNALEPGKRVCVYVFRTLFRVPVLLGVRDDKSGEKVMISRAYYRGSLLQLVFVHAMLNSIGCWIAGMIVGIVIGLGQSAVPPLLGFLAGLGASWWMAYQFRQDYHQAIADPG